MNSATLAIDVMGGDYGFKHNVAAVNTFLKKNKKANLLLVGDKNKINPIVSCNDRVRVIHTDQYIAMDESPVDALRSKKKSSIKVALDLVKNGDAKAAVSAGNTGALVALAKFSIGMESGIKRPVLAAEGIDCNGKSRLFLDLGANVDCSAKMLHQFALLGSKAFMHSYPEIIAPKVRLFNVGSEHVKGSVIIKEAAALLDFDESINYCGYVEGDGIVGSDADVIVVDGFTGNIALKSIEGTITCLLGKPSPLRNLILLLFKNSVKKRIALMPGPSAVLLGIKKPVYKVHGSAPQAMFVKALDKAFRQ